VDPRRLALVVSLPQLAVHQAIPDVRIALGATYVGADPRMNQNMQLVPGSSHLTVLELLDEVSPICIEATT
jgi:hypothetical protein